MPINKRRKPIARSASDGVLKSKRGKPLDLSRSIDTFPDGVYSSGMIEVQQHPVPAIPIGEVSDRYGMTQDQLRYLDELGVLVPHRFGGHRAYTKEDLQKLEYVRELQAQGYRPAEVRLLLAMKKLVDRPSVSGTDVLRRMVQAAKVGDVIKRPMLDDSLRAYNSNYQALRRAALSSGRKVRIGKSEDGKAVEAKIIG